MGFKPGSQYVARTCDATDFDCRNVIFGRIAASQGIEIISILNDKRRHYAISASLLRVLNVREVVSRRVAGPCDIL